MNTSFALLLTLGLIVASLWARRRAQGAGPDTQRYHRLNRGLAFAALAAALVTLWSTFADHRRADEAPPAAAPTQQP